MQWTRYLFAALFGKFLSNPCPGICYASTDDNIFGTKSQGNLTDSEGKKHNAIPMSCADFMSGRGTLSTPDGSGAWSAYRSCESFISQNQGACACREPYYGPDCTLKTCPTIDELQCAGHGNCDTTSGTCTCNDGYFGNVCTKRVCPYATNNQRLESLECNGEGECNRELGTCRCNDPRYWGFACEKRESCSETCSADPVLYFSVRCPSSPSLLDSADRSHGYQSDHGYLATHAAHTWAFVDWPGEQKIIICVQCFRCFDYANIRS